MRETKWCSHICFKNYVYYQDTQTHELWQKWGAIGNAKEKTIEQWIWVQTATTHYCLSAGALQVNGGFLQGRCRHASWVSITSCGQCGSGRGRHSGTESWILPSACSPDACVPFPMTVTWEKGKETGKCSKEIPCFPTTYTRKTNYNITRWFDMGCGLRHTWLYLPALPHWLWPWSS